MKRTIAILATLVAVPIAWTTVQPATAEAAAVPTAHMIVVRNVAGNLGTGVRCVVASTGGVDCDWSTPVPVRRPMPR
jgi:hypothetical protein